MERPRAASLAPAIELTDAWARVLAIVRRPSGFRHCCHAVLGHGLSSRASTQAAAFGPSFLFRSANAQRRFNQGNPKYGFRTRQVVSGHADQELCPADTYEIVGYLKEAVKRKDAAGNWRVVEPEEFVQGVMKPHQSPGVGFGAMEMKDGKTVNAKIWAGTQIKVPVDEAKYVISKKIAERADDIAA
jgi:hypothetical protein